MLENVGQRWIRKVFLDTYPTHYVTKGMNNIWLSYFKKK